MVPWEEPVIADSSLVVITSEGELPATEIQFVPQADLPVAVDTEKPRGRHRRDEE